MLQALISVFVMPLISGVNLILFRSGSRVRTNSNRERGHPMSSTVVEMKGV